MRILSRRRQHHGKELGSRLCNGPMLPRRTVLHLCRCDACLAGVVCRHQQHACHLLLAQPQVAVGAVKLGRTDEQALQRVTALHLAVL